MKCFPQGHNRMTRVGVESILIAIAIKQLTKFPSDVIKILYLRTIDLILIVCLHRRKAEQDERLC